MSLLFRTHVHRGSASRCPTDQNIKKKKLFVSVITQITASHVTSLLTERLSPVHGRRREDAAAGLEVTARGHSSADGARRFA